MEIKKVKRSTQEANTPPYNIATPTFSLDDIILPVEKKKEVLVANFLIGHFDKLTHKYDMGKYIGKRSKAILLYGPPGTGKSIIANALAESLGLELMTVDYSGLESSLMGQTMKNITNVFEVAQEQKVLLFFDEADAIISKRSSASSNGAEQSSNQSKNHLLMKLASVSIPVVFASNFVRSFDEAFISRVIKRIEIPLPNEEERWNIFRAHVDINSLNITFHQNSFTEQTKGFSGRDISALAFSLVVEKEMNDLPSIGTETLSRVTEQLKPINTTSSKKDTLRPSEVNSTVANALNGT